MNILVFYRSKEITNSIVSATKAQLKNKPKIFENINFVNLDKRNYIKFLQKSEEENNLPDVIVVWYDEEKIGDFILEKYPNIRLLHYSKKCTNYNCNYYGSKQYNLLSYLIEELNETLKKQTYYIVPNNLGKNKQKRIIQEKNKTEFEIYKQYDKNYFSILTKKEYAEKYLQQVIEKRIKELTKNIDCYKKKLTENEKELEELNKELERKKNK